MDKGKKKEGKEEEREEEREIGLKKREIQALKTAKKQERFSKN